MRIIKLLIENFKNIESAEIDPDKNMVVIKGPNEAGKSNVLDAWVAALGGPKHMREVVEPLRKGAKNGQVTVVLDNGWVITRSYSKSNTKGTLTITSQDGARYQSPQSLIDAVLGEISFDPIAFARMSTDDQIKMLMKLTGLGEILDALDKKREEVYMKRRDASRDMKRLEVEAAQYSDIPEHPEEIKPIDTGSVKAVLDGCKKKLDTINETDKSIQDAIRKQKEAVSRIEKARIEMEEAVKAEAQAKQEISTIMGEDMDGEKALIKISEVKEKVEGIRDEAMNKLEQAADKNNAIARIKDALAKRAELEEAVVQHNRCQDEMDKIDEQKKDSTRSAKFPIDGLSIEDDEASEKKVIYYKGVPFSQCSSSQQLRVSLAIGMAQNPDLRVIRSKEAAFFDENNWKVIREMAVDQDYQVWLEMVGDGMTGVGFCVRDGVVTPDTREE